jgi:hypothetical protein
MPFRAAVISQNLTLRSDRPPARQQDIVLAGSHRNCPDRKINETFAFGLLSVAKRKTFDFFADLGTAFPHSRFRVR